MSETNVKRVKSSEIELKDRLVSVNRVTKVTKGGRAFTFAAIVVVGDAVTGVPVVADKLVAGLQAYVLAPLAANETEPLPHITAFEGVAAIATVGKALTKIAF